MRSMNWTENDEIESVETSYPTNKRRACTYFYSVISSIVTADRDSTGHVIVVCYYERDETSEF